MDNKKLIFIGLFILVIFVFGMLTQKKYELFSVVTFTYPKTCTEFFSYEKLNNHINNNVTLGTPFCWNKNGKENRWISGMDSTPEGCQLTYTLGCDITTCNDYCKLITHQECTGSWKIAGAFPSCNCEWVCQNDTNTNTVSPVGGFKMASLLPYLPWIIGILIIVAIIIGIEPKIGGKLLNSGGK